MKAKELNSWLQIREELLRRINERHWQPGDTIPNEAELAEEFGCARTTVNRALRDLAETGLVTRKRKAGTRVAVNPPHKATFTIPIIREEVESKGGVYSHSLLKSVIGPPPPHLHGIFRKESVSELLHSLTMHYSDDRPFIFEERYTNLTGVPKLKDASLDKVSINEWLVQNAPYTDGDFVFLAQNADGDLARFYETSIGMSLLVTERTTWNDDIPITHVRMVYPPGYRMRTRL